MARPEDTPADGTVGQVSEVWTIWIVTDIRRSFKDLGALGLKERQEYVRRLRSHLAVLESMVDSMGATSSFPGKDNVSATFKDLRRAIEAAKKISRHGTEKRDEFSDRVGMHIGPGEGRAGREYDEGAAFATRIMDLCPPGYVMCSEDLLDHLTVSEQCRLGVRGPFVTKLKRQVRPVVVYAIPDEGEPPRSIKRSIKIPMWQTPSAKFKKEYNALGRLRRQGEEEKYRAASEANRIWRTCRDQGSYLLGDLAFAALYWMGRWRGIIPLQVEASRGRGDVNMARKRRKPAMKWAKRAWQLSRPSKDPFDRAFYTYQAAHILAHCGYPPKKVERSLKRAYEKFEDLEEPRMAGWAMFSAARCARLRGCHPVAENRTLASLVIFASSPNERPIAYALVEMARLRAAQDDLAAAEWYLERARTLYPNVVDKALGDAVGEPTLRSIQDRIRAADLSGKERVEDPARRLVETALVQASLGTSKQLTSPQSLYRG